MDTAKIASLEREAFHFRNIQARGELVRMIGTADANTRAIEWGLHGLQDYKTTGTKPVTEYEPRQPQAAPTYDHSTNPWAADSWSPAKQISCVRFLGVTKASEIAAAADSFVGATKPTSKNLTSYK
jgi:hypothetical protein